MRQNLFKFSGAKTYAQLVELNQELTKSGKPAEWEDFKSAGLKINEKYNLNYLQAEYQTAKQAGYHAANWEVYLRDKDLFPCLKYKTQGDNDVRDEHRRLEGIVAPLNSSFWNRYYPPNGWRCRCYTVQTAESPSEIIPDNIKEIKPEFTLNVGKKGQVFNEGDTGSPAPYFALARKQGGEQLRQSFEFSKFTAPYEKELGVEISPFSDLNDLKDNFKDAQKLVEQKVAIKIRPHINIDGWRNPEYELNGVIADRYDGSLKNGFSEKKMQILQFVDMYNAKFKDAKIDKNYSIVFNLKAIPDDAARVINGKLKNKGGLLKQVAIIYRENSVIIDREDAFETIVLKLERLKKAKAAKN